jgi:hypothetical protein
MECNGEKFVPCLHMNFTNRTETRRWYLENQAWRKICQFLA